MVKSSKKHKIRKDWMRLRFKTFVAIAEHYDLSVSTVTKILKGIDKNYQLNTINKGIKFKTALNKLLIDEDKATLYFGDMEHKELYRLVLNENQLTQFFEEMEQTAEYRIDAIKKAIASNPDVISAKKVYEERVAKLEAIELKERKQIPTGDKIRHYFEENVDDRSNL